MDLRQCPYDATPVVVETVGPAAVLIACPECGARWEQHNAHVRRIVEPDVDVVRLRRAERHLDEPGGPVTVERIRAHVRR
jgi:hypothetical protein